jgi:hypothetical protein
MYVHDDQRKIHSSRLATVFNYEGGLSDTGQGFKLFSGIKSTVQLKQPSHHNFEKYVFKVGNKWSVIY